MVNDAGLARTLVTAIQNATGEAACYLSDTPAGPSEDFACYLEYAPGVYALLGMGDTPMCHHPRYKFDDSLMGEGIYWWLTVARERAKYQFTRQQ